jgi:hypothetical protein
MLKLTVFVFWRVQYDGFSGPAVLIKIIALNILVLNHQKPRVRPLAPGIKADFTDDGVELVLVDVVGELASS